MIHELLMDSLDDWFLPYVLASHLPEDVIIICYTNLSPNFKNMLFFFPA